MNKIQFETEKRRVIELIVRLLKEGVMPHQIDVCLKMDGIPRGMFSLSSKRNTEALDMIPESCGNKLKKWEIPITFCEARFSSRLRTDILVVSIEGTFAIEIAESESEASIKKKTRAYSNMQIQFIEVRI